MNWKGRELTMKKGIALIAMLIIAAVMLSGCNLIGHDDALDNAQVIASVNGDEITKGEWKEYRNYLANYYQQYYQQNFGVSMPMTDADIESYGEAARDDLVQAKVIEQKLNELSILPLSEEDQSEAESYADNMMDLYKMMLRYQNHPGIETVEEEAARLAEEANATPDEANATADEATASEATEAEATEAEADKTAEPPVPVATITDAELDAMLTSELTELGYTREYFLENRVQSVASEKLHEYVNKDVEVTDEQVQTEFNTRADSQKTTYDETPTAYLTAVNNGTDAYYIPAGYRGIKNLLVGISDEDSSKISSLNTEITTANNTLTDAQKSLEELNAEDTSKFDADALAAYNDQIAALNETVSTATATVESKTAELEQVTNAAFEAVLPKATEALEKAAAGEDFDALIETYGTDPGMKSEPAKTRGYLVCEGLSTYDQAFQDAAMGLEKVGDISTELVKSSFGYHILQYAQDIEPGVVEYTDEIKEKLHDSMLEEAQNAAYQAAVTQWTSEADVKTYPKVMKK